MTAKEALDYAIFAINTLQEPQASSQEDVDRLDENATEVLERLSYLRRAIQ